MEIIGRSIRFNIGIFDLKMVEGMLMHSGEILLFKSFLWCSPFSRSYDQEGKQMIPIIHCWLASG